MEKMSIKKAIENQRELLQNDLQCCLDGLEEEFINRVCEVVVERFQILLDTLEGN